MEIHSITLSMSAPIRRRAGYGRRSTAKAVSQSRPGHRQPDDVQSRYPASDDVVTFHPGTSAETVTGPRFGIMPNRGRFILSTNSYRYFFTRAVIVAVSTVAPLAKE